MAPPHISTGGKYAVAEQRDAHRRAVGAGVSMHIAWVLNESGLTILPLHKQAFFASCVPDSVGIGPRLFTGLCSPCMKGAFMAPERVASKRFSFRRPTGGAQTGAFACCKSGLPEVIPCTHIVVPHYQILNCDAWLNTGLHCGGTALHAREAAQDGRVQHPHKRGLLQLPCGHVDPSQISRWNGISEIHAREPLCAFSGD